MQEVKKVNTIVHFQVHHLGAKQLFYFSKMNFHSKKTNFEISTTNINGFFGMFSWLLNSTF